MYNYLNARKQMTDVKLLLLLSNTWNHLTVSKTWAQACLKCYQQNVLQIIYIQYICINMICH